MIVKTPSLLVPEILVLVLLVVVVVVEVVVVVIVVALAMMDGCLDGKCFLFGVSDLFLACF